MKLLQIFIISLVVILLMHLTLKNVLTSYEVPTASSRDAQMNRSDTHPARDEMLDFVRGHLLDLERNKQQKPKASNYYGQFHDSDVNPELTNLSQYFEVEQSVPDTRQLINEINGSECGPNGIKDCKDPKKVMIDSHSGNPMRFDMGSDGTLAFLPDQWSYKNEKPMNGGKINGVRGLDSAVGDFAIYPGQPKDGEDANFVRSYSYVNTFKA
jgi:hypothetical protein